MTGIEALEQWSRDLEPSVMLPYYKDVLPYLNDYLKSSAKNSKYRILVSNCCWRIVVVLAT